MRPRNTCQPNWFRLAVMVIAVGAVLFVATGASLWHLDAPGSEATCPICHLAHMPVLGSMSSVPLAAPVFVAWILPAKTQIASNAQSALSFPPRAPPV